MADQIDQTERIEQIDRIAKGQHGLVTSSQAVAALGPSRTKRWAASGRLVSVQPRVWRVAGAPATWHQDLLAAQLSSAGLVGCRSAGALLQLTSATDLVEVSVRQRQQPRLRPPAVVHRSVDLDPRDYVEVDGLRVTTACRTIVDLGLVLREAQVADAVSTGLARRILSVEDLRAIRARLSRCGRNGVGVLGRVLDDRFPLLAAEESVLEGRLLTLLRRSGLPAPSVQFEVRHAGRFVARVDAAYPDQRVAIELDGYEHHTSSKAFQRDRARQNELVSLGWTVLRFTWHDVVNRPQTVVAAIARVLGLPHLSARRSGIRT